VDETRPEAKPAANGDQPEEAAGGEEDDRNADEMNQLVPRIAMADGVFGQELLFIPHNGKLSQRTAVGKHLTKG
jgi:hypothetical protein